MRRAADTACGQRVGSHDHATNEAGSVVVRLNRLSRRERRIQSYVQWLRSSPNIDAVYRWVNPRRLSQHQRAAIGNAQRYRDNAELRFSLRSFHRVHGFRHFHIVGGGEAPAWLRADHPRVRYWEETWLLQRLVSERKLSTAGSLPGSPLLGSIIERDDSTDWGSLESAARQLIRRIRSSEPAKLAIAYIPQLADRFLLLDDDMFAIPQAGSLHA